jgi:hypothetical protein
MGSKKLFDFISAFNEDAFDQFMPWNLTEKIQLLNKVA